MTALHSLRTNHARHATLGFRSLQILRRLAFLGCILALFWPSGGDAIGDLVPSDQLESCAIKSDNWVGNAQDAFGIIEWIRRGLCVRQDGTDEKCYSSLNHVLDEGLNEIRKAEYSGAAGVLALLPTIGALLGTPTSEIWRLLTMVPFGGALAMAISFGGAILPVKAEDYESDFMKNKINRNRSSFKNNLKGKKVGDSEYDLTRQYTDGDYPNRRVDILMEQVRKRFKTPERKPIPVDYIWIGLIGMVLLFFGAHASMVIVEQGAVLPWWCGSRWWIHFWYLMVIITAVVDNYVQLPFVSQWTLILSDIPYDIAVDGGDDIASSLVLAPDAEHQEKDETAFEKEQREAKSVGLALKQLNTLRPGAVTIMGSPQPSEPRNVLFVMVSIVEKRPTRLKIFLRACSQLASIGVFITGTAMFASAQLLSIAMATFILTLVLAAGVFGRTIAGWIVIGIEQVEPMIHFVAEDHDEAHHIIRELLLFRLDEGDLRSEQPADRKIQCEIGGHIFVDQRRVARRSRLARLTLGIIAPVFDLAKAKPGRGITSGGSPFPAQEQMPLSPQQTSSASYNTHTMLDDTSMQQQQQYGHVGSGAGMQQQYGNVGQQQYGNVGQHGQQQYGNVGK